ncbi:MAG: pilus assembly protein PilP [Polaromonas sp.]|nr:pilus assembly protein PilP [Polaromonas sp.]
MKTYSWMVALRMLWTRVGGLAFLVVLIGCVEVDHEDLEIWMEKERVRHTPKLSTAHPPVVYQAPVFTLPQGIEPFSRQRLMLPSDSTENVIPLITSQQASVQAAPPLEAAPLSGMRLVGSVFRDGQPMALLRVNGLLYPVRIGDRLGQDQGRVSAISLSGLVLREVAMDAEGQSKERVIRFAVVSEP